MNKRPYEISERIYQWSLDVLKICDLLPPNRLGQVIYGQLIRSATSVSANLIEAGSGLSKKDFIKCLGISLKECNESRLWLRYIVDKTLISLSKVDPIKKETEEIAKIIATIILKSKRSLK